MENVEGFAESHWMLPSDNYLLRIALASAQVLFKTTTMKECIQFAGNFDGHGGAPVQYSAHCPIEEVQGFTRSHWTPPSSKYCGQ
jgi:hypothetical protein